MKFNVQVRIVFVVRVASHRGAWIEIYIIIVRTLEEVESRPTGARGLKFKYQYQIIKLYKVASHRGAWIEIRNIIDTKNS